MFPFWEPNRRFGLSVGIHQYIDYLFGCLLLLLNQRPLSSATGRRRLRGPRAPLARSNRAIRPNIMAQSDVLGAVLRRIDLIDGS